MNLNEIVEIYSEFPSGKKSDELFEKLKNIPFNGEIHYPVIYYNIYYCFLEKAKILLDKCEIKDETYYQLNDFYESMREVSESNYGVFPLNISWRKRWDGPHLNFPKEINGIPLTQWNPGRILYLEKDFVQCVLSKKENEKCVYVEVKLPQNKFQNTQEGTMFEIAFYDEEFVILCHEETSWKQTEELKSLHQIIEPIILSIENKIREFSNSFRKI